MTTPTTLKPTGVRTYVRETVLPLWAANLTARMAAVGVTQQVLADTAGCSRQTVSSIVTGRMIPGDALRGAFALVLDAEPADLFPPPTLAALRGAIAATAGEVCQVCGMAKPPVLHDTAAA